MWGWSRSEKAAAPGYLQMMDENAEDCACVADRCLWATTAVSPLAVEGVDLGLTQAEIVEFVHAGRKSWDEN